MADIMSARSVLTEYESRVLGWVRRKPLRVIIGGGKVEFWTGPIKVRRKTAERLIKTKYLAPVDLPLLSEALAQSYTASATNIG
jgi:hypothetical protein